MSIARVSNASSVTSSCSILGSTTTITSTISQSPPLKLHGRAFYESIGSPKLVLAPMVDQSEFAWRLLTRSFLPSDSFHSLLAYTPMFHSRLFAETPKFRDAHFQPLRTSLISHSSLPEADYFLDGNPKLDRPLFVQFCANNPQELLAAAKYVSPFCDAVDLNLGCPQGIAKKGRYGAFLQEDQELIYSLINTLHKQLDIPVTAKIRILDTQESTLEYAQNLLKAGASIITVHGRTREMKGHKTGLADWNVIRFLRDNLPSDTVIFANGNILKNEDIARCLEVTGADAVMSAEGNLYDPAIFVPPPKLGEEGREFWRGQDGKGGWRMDAVFRRYMDIIYKYVLEVSPPERKPLYLPTDPEPEYEGEVIMKTRKREMESASDELAPNRKKQKKSKTERTCNPNLLAMQAHLFHLLRPLVSRHHHVRDSLARCRAGDIIAFESILKNVEDVVRDGLKKYNDTQGKSWDEEFEQDKRLNADYYFNPPKHELSGLMEKLQGQELGDDEAHQLLGESSFNTVKSCKRPWWVVQPHIRPLPNEALAHGSWALSKKDKKAIDATKITHLE